MLRRAVPSCRALAWVGSSAASLAGCVSVQPARTADLRVGVASGGIPLGRRADEDHRALKGKAEAGDLASVRDGCYGNRYWQVLAGMPKGGDFDEIRR